MINRIIAIIVFLSDLHRIIITNITVITIVIIIVVIVNSIINVDIMTITALCFCV